MLLKIKNKKENIFINCEKVGFWKGFIGLMFKKRNYKNLYFIKASNIHSLFVFHNFLAVWLDEKNEVVKVDLVKPFRFLIKKPANAKRLVEVQLNDKNKKIIEKILN